MAFLPINSRRAINSSPTNPPAGFFSEAEMTDFDKYGDRRYSVRGWWLAGGALAAAIVILMLLRWVL